MRKINLPKDLLISMYVNQQMTTYQIADELGVHRQTIANKLKEYGIELRDSHFKAKPKKKVLKKVSLDYKNKEVFEKFYKKFKAIDLVAKHFNINVKTAYSWKKIHGIETIKQFSAQGKERINMDKPWTDRDTLMEYYAQYSTVKLGELWNCHPTTIQKWLKKFGIKASSYAEQWEKEAKFGTVVVKEDDFDLQAYKNQIKLSDHLSKKTLAYIKSVVGKCQACGYDKVLDLHHIDEDRTNNDPENHVILCPNCHALIHRMGKTVEELCPDFISWADILEESYAQAK